MSLGSIRRAWVSSLDPRDRFFVLLGSVGAYLVFNAVLVSPLALALHAYLAAVVIAVSGLIGVACAVISRKMYRGGC